MAKTPVERQRKSRNHKRLFGLTEVTLWLPKDQGTILRFRREAKAAVDEHLEELRQGGS